MTEPRIAVEADQHPFAGGCQHPGCFNPATTGIRQKADWGFNIIRFCDSHPHLEAKPLDQLKAEEPEIA